MQEFIFPKNNLYYKMNDFRLDRPTLVFVHGLSGSSSAWIEYEKFFEKKYNVLSFDLRGHGKSPRMKKYEDFEIKHFAQDLYDLIQYLEIKDFVLISHSFGTLIALEFLVEHQDLVKATVFLSPSFAVEKRRLAKAIKPLLGLTRVIDLIPFSPKPGNHIDYNNYKNTGDWNLRRMIADVSNTGLRAYFYSTRQSYKFNREDFLEKISIPTLIVHGKDDTIFPVTNSLVMAKKIPNSDLIILENTDHIVVLNNFSEVSEAIENFVEKIRGLRDDNER